MQWSADNLVPRYHVRKEAVKKRCFDSIQTESFDDVTLYKIELTLSMLTRFSLSCLPAS